MRKDFYFTILTAIIVGSLICFYLSITDRLNNLADSVNVAECGAVRLHFTDAEGD